MFDLFESNERERGALVSSLDTRPIYVHGGIANETLPDVRAFMEIWQTARGERFAPSWSELDLIDFPSHIIPLVYVVDVERDPLRFRYRFIGSKVCEFEGTDYTGQYVCDLKPAAVGQAAQSAFERFLDDPEPRFFAMLVDELDHMPHVFSIYGGIRVPLSDDNKEVHQIMGLAQFETEHKLLRKYYWEMVRRA